MNTNEEQKKIDKKRLKKKQWKVKSKTKKIQQRELVDKAKERADREYFAKYKTSPLFNLLSMPLNFDNGSSELSQDIKNNISALHDFIMKEAKGRNLTKHETTLISICRKFSNYTGSASQKAELHYLCWEAARYFFTVQIDSHTYEKNIIVKDVFMANRLFDLACYFFAGSQSFQTELITIVFSYGLQCSRLEILSTTPKQWRNAALLLGMECDYSMIGSAHFAYLNAAAAGDQNLLPYVASIACPLVSRQGTVLMMEKFPPKQYRNNEQYKKVDGYVPAKFCLSYFYFYGKGVKKDIDKAFELLIEARNQNDCSLADYMCAMFLNTFAKGGGNVASANKLIKQYLPEEKETVQTKDDIYRSGMNLWIRSGKKILDGEILTLSRDEEILMNHHFHFMSIAKKYSGKYVKTRGWNYI